MLVRFPISQARRGDYCAARINGKSSREGYYDTPNGRFWKCTIVEVYPKGILKVETRGHWETKITHVDFVLDKEAWGSRMRTEIEELRAAGHLIEKAT